MNKLKFIFIFQYILILTLQAENSYFVSTKGSDLNLGTKNAPFKTLQKAISVLQKGDVCYVRQGTYNEIITLSSDGTESSPVRIQNFKNDTVLITSSIALSNWKLHKESIYKTYCPSKILQIFNGSIESPIASYPNITNMLNTDQWLNANIDSVGKLIIESPNFSKDYWKGASCRVLAGNNWVAHLGEVVSNYNNELNLTNKLFPFSSIKKGYLGKGKAYILGHLNAIDIDNEWVWQNDTLYYFIPKTQMSQTFIVQARINEYAINATNRKYIILSGLNFFGTSLNFNDSEGCIIENGSINYPTPFFNYGLGWGRQVNYKIDSNATLNWKGKGVYISGKNNVVRNMYVAHSWGDGISLGGENNTVKNCYIEDCDWSLTDCAAISATGYKLNILNNTCHTTGRSVIVHRFADKINIMYNHLYNGGLGTDDLGLTYSYETNGNGAQIAYNWIHDNQAPHTASGIYLDNNDTSYVVHHNVIWNCKYGIHTNKNAVNHLIYNNTLFDCENSTWDWGPPGTTIQNQKVYNNWSEKELIIGTEFKNNIVEPKSFLKNPSDFKFWLLPTSSAYKVETSTKYSSKIKRKKLDVGAYESQIKPWVAGSTSIKSEMKFPILAY